MPVGIYPHKRTPLHDRFWKYVDKLGPDECWLWTGTAKAQGGYGRLHKIERKQGRAHRVSWEIHRGPIPPGMKVLHRCDNPPCCNPDHLFLGTMKDNTHDALAKGRMKKPPVHFGDGHHKATISDSEIPAIRTSKEIARALAVKYSVNISTIYRIKRGETRNAI